MQKDTTDTVEISSIYSAKNTRRDTHQIRKAPFLQLETAKNQSEQKPLKNEKNQHN